ncbi:MAG: hypothetical protein JNK05_22240 [Myxococcales bacterium]|nr:hypothetical protein [Myxococcales bacterium]
MGKLRSSDLAVAAALSIVAWLIVRTALRVDVAPSVCVVSITYVLALAARSRVGDERREVDLPLFEFVLALIVVRALEATSFVDRRASAATACSVLAVVGCSLVGARRGSTPLFVTLSTAIVALAAIVGAASDACTALWFVALARVVAVGAQRVSPTRLASFTAAVAIGAALWATRGATIGPIALLVGASGARGGLKLDERPRIAIADGVLFVALALTLVVARAWERSTLVFL